MSRMFKLWKNGRIATVNPFNGCRFNCYGGRCWAAQMAKRLEARGIKGYENGFEPSFVFEQMNVPSDADALGLSKTSVRRTAKSVAKGIGGELPSLIVPHLNNKKTLKGGEK